MGYAIDHSGQMATKYADENARLRRELVDERAAVAALGRKCTALQETVDANAKLYEQAAEHARLFKLDGDNQNARADGAEEKLEQAQAKCAGILRASSKFQHEISAHLSRPHHGRNSIEGWIYLYDPACLKCQIETGKPGQPLLDLLARAQDTCATVYQWAGANDFPFEILDNLSIIAEGAEAEETSQRPYHKKLPRAVDLKAQMRGRTANLEEVREAAHDLDFYRSGPHETTGSVSVEKHRRLERALAACEKEKL